MIYGLFRYQTKLRYFKYEGFTWLQAFAHGIHCEHNQALLLIQPLRYLLSLQVVFVPYRLNLICDLECRRAQFRVEFALRLFPF